MVMFRPNNVGQSQSSTTFSKKNRIVDASAVASPPPSQVIQSKQLPLASRKPVFSPGNVPLQGPGHGDTGNSQTSSSNINQYIVNPYPTLTTYSIDPTHQSPSPGDTSTNRLANATSSGNNAESNGGASASVSSNAATGTDGPTQPSADDSFDGLVDFSTNNVQAGSNQLSSDVSTVGQAQTAAGSPGGNDQGINRTSTSGKQTRTGISSSSGSATAFGTAGQSQGGFQTSRQTLQSAGSSSLGQTTQQGSGVSTAGVAQTGGRTGVNNQGTKSVVAVDSQGRPGVSASGSSQFPGQTSLGSVTASGSTGSGQGGQQATSGSLQTSITGSGSSGQNAQQGTNKQTSTAVQNLLTGRVTAGTSTQPSSSLWQGGSSLAPLDINSADDRFTSVWGPPNTDASVSTASAGDAVGHSQTSAGSTGSNQVTALNGQVQSAGSTSQQSGRRPNPVQSQSGATAGSFSSSASTGQEDAFIEPSTGQGTATAGSSSANTAQGNGPRGILTGQGISTGQAGVSGVAVGQGNSAYDLQFQNIWMPVPHGTDSMHFSATPDFNRYNEIPGPRTQGPSQERAGQASAAGMSSNSQASANAQRTSTNGQAQTAGISSNRVFVSGEATITSNPLQVQMPSGPASSRNQTQARTVSPQTDTGKASLSAASAFGTSRPNQDFSSASSGGSSESSASSSRIANSQSLHLASSNTAPQTTLTAAHPITVKIFTACDKDATSSLATTDMGSAMLNSLQSSSTLRQTSSSQHATVIVNGYASYNSDVTGGASGNSVNRSGTSGGFSGATRSAATDYSMPSNPMISDDAYFIHESADKPVFVRFAKYNIIVEIRPDITS
ncbi:hypothetical protein RvY_02519-2 [Ramazzottius varieornatus]|nr:hypothetical protein RvY_02519-2 [Ramazzottius varieornatus]